MVDPWLIVGWMGVAFGALYFGRYALHFIRWVADRYPTWKKQTKIRTGLARCEWFEWSTANPDWPHEIGARGHDGKIRYHCTRKAEYRLDYGALRCDGHRRSFHGSTFSQAHPLRRSA